MTGEDVAARVHAYAWTDRKPGLERTRALLAALGNPEKALKFVHITGSNGKGSTAAMLASVLQRAGYRTGLYTSPHLLRFHERMRVNGEEIDDESLISLTNTVRNAAERMSEMPTGFEIMTAIAFLYFVQEQCDIVSLEVGLGARVRAWRTSRAKSARRRTWLSRSPRRKSLRAFRPRSTVKSSNTAAAGRTTCGFSASISS